MVEDFLMCLGEAVIVIDPKNRSILQCNRAAELLFEFEKAELTGQKTCSLFRTEKEDAQFAGFLQTARSNKVTVHAELQMRTKNGAVIETEHTLTTTDEISGRSGSVLSIVHDITRRKQAEKELQHQKNLLEKSQELGHIGTWEFDLKQDKLFWTSEIYRIFDMPVGSDLNYATFLEKVHPEDRNHVIRKWQASLDGDSHEIEHRLLVGDQVKWVRQKAFLEIGAKGEAVKAIGYVQDITDRKQAEEEKERLEKQLQHTQKIESVGRLAGGVAHDYNNMLSVIIGNAELAQMKLASSDPVQEDLEEILKAATRSRDITQKLLAFARKQNIMPCVVNLNEAIEITLKMLRQLLGENIDLVWQPKGELWSVEIDPSQLDQILANLCVNARDAIPDVGRLTIETDMVSLDQAYCHDHTGFMPGDFVILAVSDNGCGMDQETLGYIFEPFFSTKPLGTGTGLGLATVYGIVKQSNGFINVYSEEGAGSTFKIYLPRYLGPIADVKGEAEQEVPKGAGETILLVEDEVPLLKLMTTLLEDLDYKVLAANSPLEALGIIEAHADEIDLLVTDMVMPEMNGRELAERLKRIQPKIRCLYMSGYTETAIAHHGVLEKGANFIHKPFSRGYFGVQIKRILS
ncbi:MAG TPA: ATP-binding protein [Desulfuromonadales bacterium]|nr:ATP-binding protein [Desulfuromonadales bacterium]